MNHRWILIFLAPVLVSCSQTYAVRFQPRAFPTRPGQKVVITTARGRTEIRGVAGSRDIQVEGTVETIAVSPLEADLQAGAVRVADVSIPESPGPALRLEVSGIPAGGGTRFDSQFRVPRDIRLEIHDGPEDLLIEGIGGGVTIVDGAGDIELRDWSGPVEITDLDGSVLCYGGQGSVRINDRRGDISVEDVTGNVDITDVEGDALVQSISGNLSFAKRDRGTVRINNIDGLLSFPAWNNSLKPIINTIWEKDRERPRPAGGELGKAPPAPRPGTAPASVPPGASGEPAPAAASVPDAPGGPAKKDAP